MSSHEFDIRTQIWRDLAGDYFDRLVSDFSFARSQLYNPVPGVRAAAIHLCFRRWGHGSDESFRNECRRIAVADPDISVRVIAMITLSSCMTGSKSDRDSKLLADIVVNQANPIRVRFSAYLGLREIQFGYSVSDAMTRLDFMARERSYVASQAEIETANEDLGGKAIQAARELSTFESEIDWSFVRRFT